MSPEASAATASPLALRLAGATLLVGAALTASGCTPHIGQHEGAAPVADACKQPAYLDSQTDKETAAKRCLRAMEAGTLAVVNFGVPADAAQAVDTRLGDLIKKATNGKVTVKVQGFTASDAAQAALQKSMGTPGCIDSTKPDKFAGAAADTTMPEVHKADFIITLAPEKACTPGVEGADGGHYSDAYAGNMPEYVKANALPRGLELTALHEFGHMIALGHVGRVLRDGRVATGNMGDNIDITQFLQQTGIKYSEYDGDNFMGRLEAPDQILRDVVQESQLHWPQDILDGSQSSPAKGLAGGPVSFDAKAAADGQFAVADLRDSIRLTDDEAKKETAGQTGTHQFNGLAIVPRISDKGNFGVELILLGDGNVLASLGTLGNGPETKNATSIITIDGQRIEVRVAGGRTTVRMLEPAS
ncbi:MAG TPA: hypothetical protein VLF71_02025 [Candidatus Saccharimonadales bacterium]|nr:hypothetical protein [Candidatus Saccharimonadales bacterium]